MDSAERACVFYHKPGVALPEAEASLRAKGLAVTRKGDLLQVAAKNGPTLEVRQVHGAGVRKDAVRLGRAKPLEALLRECDAAFVITFKDLDQVLADGKLLTDVQLVLQALTDGVIARSWNDELSGPEES